MRIGMVVLGLGALTMLACGGRNGKGSPPDPSPVPSPVPEAPAPPRPGQASNVLVVVMDDVGVDKVASYGKQHRPPPTPTLDRLASDGVRFTRVWSHPVCSPTRASILTGRLSRRTGIGMIIDSWKNEPELAESEITIPEMLGRASRRWDSSAVGKWHLASKRSGDPATHAGRQGFGWWAGTLGNLRDDYGDDRGGGYGYTRWLENDNGKVKEATGYVTSDTADDAIARMGAMQEPWFLYVAFNAAHFPAHVPPASLVDTKGLGPRSPELDLYDAMVQALDHEIGRMLDAMDPKLRARTTVMVVGDNGTPDFGVRPPLDPERAKGSVFELGIHVPLIVTGPYVSKPGSESRALVHTADLFATVADIAGVDPNSLGRPIDGVSFLPSLADPGRPGRQYVYTEKFAPNGPGPYDRLITALRDDRYKLVVDRKKDGSIDERLFDVGDEQMEGPNLLRGEGRSREAGAAYTRLKAEMDRMKAELDR